MNNELKTRVSREITGGMLDSIVISLIFISFAAADFAQDKNIAGCFAMFCVGLNASSVIRRYKLNKELKQDGV